MTLCFNLLTGGLDVHDDVGHHGLLRKLCCYLFLIELSVHQNDTLFEYSTIPLHFLEFFSISRAAF